METTKTLLQAVRYFTDLDICEDYMREIRWAGNPPVCPHCGSMRIGEIKTRRLLRCKDCRKQFSLLDETIFANSPIHIGKWFMLIWCEANQIKTSTKQLAEMLEITQRTAWSMRTKIRAAGFMGKE